jgi:thiazole synthase
VATANDPVAMAGAFDLAVRAGRQAYLAGLGRVIQSNASASSPLTGFLHE